MLLASDVDYLNPATLGKAAQQWVRTQRWMPRAFDLISLCDKFSATPTQQQQIDHGNSHLLSMNRHDIHWFIANGRVCVGARLA